MDDILFCVNKETISSHMIRQLTRKLNYSYEQLSDFIREENLRTEAFLTFTVIAILLFILYS
jgi:diacylglycerol kinase